MWLNGSGALEDGEVKKLYHQDEEEKPQARMRIFARSEAVRQDLGHRDMKRKKEQQEGSRRKRYSEGVVRNELS